MPEQLSNDALKLAADSTARAITKKKDLSITKRNWNNFPSSEVHIPLPPRAKRKLDQWRGSLDTQLFWKKFHKNLKEELALLLNFCGIFSRITVYLGFPSIDQVFFLL